MAFEQTQNVQQKITRRAWIVFCISIVVLLTLLQWHGLGNNFVSDDYDWVRNARERIEQKNVFDAFKTPTGGNFYRPLVAFGFELDYAIFGYHPTGYHVHQLLFHIALVLGVAFLLWQLFLNRGIAFAAALLFAVYPSQHEVITWIAGRPDIYAATFVVFALGFFVLFLRKKNWVAYAACLALSACGFLSKEISFILPALACIAIPIVLRSFSIKKMWKAALWVIPIVLVLGAVLLIRSHVITDAIGGYLVGDERKGLNFDPINIAKPFTSIVYLVNWSYVLESLGHQGAVLQNLFQRALSHWWILGSAVLALAILITKKIKNSQQKILLLFGISWSVIAFIPVYGLSGAISLNLTASRLFFSSSIGYAIILTAIFWPLSEPYRWKKIRKTLFSALVLIFVGLWIVNYIPWSTASKKVDAIRQKFIEQKDQLIPPNTTHVIVTSMPGLYDGAYMYFGVHSVRETIYELTKNASLKVFLGGNRPYTDLSVCSYDAKNKVAIFAWNQESQQFISGNPQVTEKINSGEKARQAITWNFKNKATANQWSPKGVATRQTDSGIELAISKGTTYIESPAFSPSFLGGFSSMDIAFTITDAPHEFGTRRALISWGTENAFAGGNYIAYSYGDEPSQHIVIPTCQYTNWIVSDEITKLRIQPISSGTVVLHSITLSP